MANYNITEGLFLYPTPAGSYYATFTNERDKSRNFLRQLFLQSTTPALNLDNLQRMTGISDSQKCFELLHHCQKLKWIQGLESERQYPSDLLENILPSLLNKVSESGKVLLADMQGFYLASHGFPHEVSEELSALSAEIATIYERRSGLLTNNMGIASHAWAVVDAFGNSQIGFWPLFIGGNRFVIAISGVPHFNQPEFVDLIWALSMRYAEKTEQN
jgi:hypothetical protein